MDKQDIFFGKHRNHQQSSYWHAYTEVQILRTFELCELLIDHYGITNIVGHEEIAPSRKTDPGPAFPLDRLRNQFFGEMRDEDDEPERELFAMNQKLVNNSKLNIRSGSGTDFSTVAEPISKGTTLAALETKNGWVRVEYRTQGWVSGQFVQPLK